MINNRQGGRRRGRGGQRGPNLGGQSGGNRPDNRQRGNAAQLLEKYKSMARDSQLAGDRVQTEYYLQFADHYFRVLSESRARFDDQRRQRGDDLDDDEGDDDFVEAEAETSAADDRPERRDREERAPRPNRPQREPRRFARDERSAGDGEDESDEPRMNGARDSLPLDVLPPAIGADEAAAADEPAPRPRRRPRSTRPTDGEDEIAPAA